MNFVRRTSTRRVASRSREQRTRHARAHAGVRPYARTCRCSPRSLAREQRRASRVSAENVPASGFSTPPCLTLHQGSRDRFIRCPILQCKYDEYAKVMFVLATRASHRRSSLRARIRRAYTRYGDFAESCAFKLDTANRSYSRCKYPECFAFGAALYAWSHRGRRARFARPLSPLLYLLFFPPLPFVSFMRIRAYLCATSLHMGHG